MLTLGILGSGSGSNMQAILDAITVGTLQAKIAIVLSDNPKALILKRAASHGIPHAVIDCEGHDAFPSKILNIHPSLLPAFPGVAAWAQAVEAKAKETGVTVHVVDSGMDTGLVILQEKLDILPAETADALHKRIQVIEHRIYPMAISQYAHSLNL